VRLALLLTSAPLIYHCFKGIGSKYCVGDLAALARRTLNGPQAYEWHSISSSHSVLPCFTSHDGHPRKPSKFHPRFMVASIYQPRISYDLGNPTLPSFSRLFRFRSRMHLSLSPPPTRPRQHICCLVSIHLCTGDNSTLP